MNIQLMREASVDRRSRRRWSPTVRTVRTRFGHLVAAVRAEDGAATAEYAVATMAAVGFAGLLVIILRGDEVRGILTDLIRRALAVSV